MKNIFIIDKATKQNLGMLDFIPRKDDRIVLKISEWTRAEGVVVCVLYEPLENGILVLLI